MGTFNIMENVKTNKIMNILANSISFFRNMEKDKFYTNMVFKMETNLKESLRKIKNVERENIIFQKIKS